MTVAAAGGRKGAAAGSRHQSILGHRVPVETLPPREVQSLIRDDAGVKVVAVMGPRLLLLRQEAEITACALAAAHKTRAAGLKRRRSAPADAFEHQAPGASDAAPPAASSPSNTSSQTATRPALFAIPPSLNGTTLNVTAEPPTPTNMARPPVTAAPATAGQRPRKKAKKGGAEEAAAGQPSTRIPQGATLHCFPVPLQSKLGKKNLSRQQQQRQGSCGPHRTGAAIPPGGVRVPVSVVPSLVVVASQPAAPPKPGARTTAAKRQGAATPSRARGQQQQLQLARVASNKVPALSPGSRTGSGVAVIGVPGANTPPTPPVPPAQMPPPPTHVPPAAVAPAAIPAAAAAQLPPRAPPATSQRTSRAPPAGVTSPAATTATGQKRKSWTAAQPSAIQQQPPGAGQQQGMADVATLSEQQRRWNLEQRKLLMGHFDSITQQDDTSPKKSSVRAQKPAEPAQAITAPAAAAPAPLQVYSGQVIQGPSAGVVPGGQQALGHSAVWGRPEVMLPSYPQQQFQQQQQAQLQLMQQQAAQQQQQLQQQRMMQLQQQLRLQQEQQQQRAAAMPAAVVRPAPIPSDDDDDEEEEEEEEEEGPAITPGLLAAQAWLSKLRLAQQEFDTFKEEALPVSSPLGDGSESLLQLAGPPRANPTVPELVRVRAALERCIQEGDHTHAELLLGLLARMPLTPVLLAASQVAAAVVPLRRHLHPLISQAARSLVQQWREAVSVSIRSGGLAVMVREGGEPAPRRHLLSTHQQQGGRRRASATGGGKPSGLQPLAIPQAPAASDVVPIPTPGAQEPQLHTTLTPGSAAPPPAAAATAGRLTFGSWAGTRMPALGTLQPPHQLQGSQQTLQSIQLPAASHLGNQPSALVQPLSSSAAPAAGNHLHGMSRMTAPVPAPAVAVGPVDRCAQPVGVAHEPKPFASQTQMSGLGDGAGAPLVQGSMTDLSMLAGTSTGPASLLNGMEASDLHVGISAAVTTATATAAALKDDACGGGNHTIKHAPARLAGQVAPDDNSAAINSIHLQSHAAWKAGRSDWQGFPAQLRPAQATMNSHQAQRLRCLAAQAPHLYSNCGPAVQQQQEGAARNGFYSYPLPRAQPQLFHQATPSFAALPAVGRTSGPRNGEHVAAASVAPAPDLGLLPLPGDEDVGLIGGDEFLAPLSSGAQQAVIGEGGGVRKRARLSGWGLGRSSPDHNDGVGGMYDDEEEDVLLLGSCAGGDGYSSPTAAAAAARMDDCCLLLNQAPNSMGVV